MRTVAPFFVDLFLPNFDSIIATHAPAREANSCLGLNQFISLFLRKHYWVQGLAWGSAEKSASLSKRKRNHFLLWSCEQRNSPLPFLLWLVLVIFHLLSIKGLMANPGSTWTLASCFWVCIRSLPYGLGDTWREREALAPGVGDPANCDSVIVHGAVGKKLKGNFPNVPGSKAGALAEGHAVNRAGETVFSP